MLAAAAVVLVSVSLTPPLLVTSVARAGLRDIAAGSGGVSVQRSKVTDATQFDAFQRQAQAQADRLLAGRLLGPAELARLGPLPATAINGTPPASPGATARVLVMYASDLAHHVEVVQGQLPDAIQDPTAQAVSISEDQADRAGVHLSDQICFGAAGDVQWCPRLVGLWRAVNGSDAYWATGGPGPILFTNRAGYFALLGLLPSASTTAQRWYWPDPAGLTPAKAGALGDQVGRLRVVTAASPSLEVQTSLDHRLSSYSAARDAATFVVGLLTAALVALALLLILALARRLVRLQSRELTLLVVRGWAPVQIQRLLAIELGLVAAAGIPAGMVLAWLAFAVLDPSHLLWPLSDLDLSDLAGAGAALAAGLLGAQLVFAWVTSLATRPDWFRQVWAGRPEESVEPRTPRAVVGLLLPAAVILLLLPHLAGGRPSSGLGEFVRAFGYLLAVGALGMLVAATIQMLSPAAALLAQAYRGVEGTMARWQLRSWWLHHPALGFIVVFAVATATFAAVNMANLLMDGGSPLGGGSFQRGVVAALGAGFATSVLVALLGFGAELRFTCASRLPDYGALMADGLPARSIRRSLALEHNQVLLLGVPVGTILGLALLWSVAPVAGLEVAHVGLSAGGVVIGVLMTALSMSIGGLLAAGLVRSRVRFLPYEVPL